MHREDLGRGDPRIGHRRRSRSAPHPAHHTSFHQRQGPCDTEAERRAERAGELEDWRQAIGRYADNALSASEQLIKGSAGFDDLRPSLDRMASDLEAAQKLGIGRNTITRKIQELGLE